VYSSFKLIHYSIAFKNGKKKAGSCDFYIIIKLNNPKKKKKKEEEEEEGRSQINSMHTRKTLVTKTQKVSLSLSLSLLKKKQTTEENIYCCNVKKKKKKKKNSK